MALNASRQPECRGRSAQAGRDELKQLHRNGCNPAEMLHKRNCCARCLVGEDPRYSCRMRQWTASYRLHRLRLSGSGQRPRAFNRSESQHGSEKASAERNRCSCCYGGAVSMTHHPAILDQPSHHKCTATTVGRLSFQGNSGSICMGIHSHCRYPTAPIHSLEGWVCMLINLLTNWAAYDDDRVGRLVSAIARVSACRLS